MKKKPQNVHGSLIEILKSADIKIHNKDSVGALINSALDNIVNEDHRKHGFRIESMFAYMAGALGNCSLVKQEDCGGLCFVEDESVGIPDYRVVLKNSDKFLVEVKNCASRKILFKEKYIIGLKKYASINDCPLKIAIYWSSFKIWTLISPDWFIFTNGKFQIEFDRAMAMNEMAQLKDRMIGTKAPLTIRLIADQDKTSELDSNGQCVFTIGEVAIYCDGNLITNKTEQEIAFQLILSGKWQEQDRAHIENKKISYMEYEYTPLEINEEQGFNLVGFLSSIVSEKYDVSTVRDGEIERLVPAQEPEQFKIFIPEDYKGNVLPLWQLIIQPNPGYEKRQ